MSTQSTDALYTLDHATIHNWASVSGNLDQDKLALLQASLVGTRVLDAGCGGGAYVDYLARAGYDATGVDKFDAYLDVARSNTWKGRFVQADLTDRLPFVDGEFDCTYCFDVLEHVDDVSALRELARVTRSRIILTVPQDDRIIIKYLLTFPPYKDVTHLRYYTPDSLQALAATVHPKAVALTGQHRIHLERLFYDNIRFSRFSLIERICRKLYRTVFWYVTVTDIYFNLVAVIDLDDARPLASTADRSNS